MRKQEIGDYSHTDEETKVEGNVDKVKCPYNLKLTVKYLRQMKYNVPSRSS